MPLDGITLYSVANELKELVDSSVQKIYQPEKDEILLVLHTKDGTKKLILSSSPQNPRVYITNASYKNPESAPMFCMLLRKHFTGGKIKAVNQAGLDRIIDLTFECHSELGDLTNKHIVIEIMSRNSNIIVTDEEYKIYDCLRKNDLFSESDRTILPGFIYKFPSKDGKCDILKSDDKEILDFLSCENPSYPKLLLGFSPLADREGEFYGSKEKYALEIKNKLESREFSPTVIFDEDNKPFDFWCFDIKEYGDKFTKKTFPSMSEALETYYHEKALKEHLKQKNASLSKLLSNLITRAEKKLKIQRKELLDAGKKEEFKVMGDLIKANLYKIKEGEKIAEVSDWSSWEEKIIHIPLDENLSPSENAQRYYKKYAKAKKAEEVLTEQISKTLNEIEYLKSVLLSLSESENIEDITQIKEELADGGYIKVEKGKKKKESESKPLLFEREGFSIYVGKNNKQNDLLTLKTAEPYDIWLHVKNNTGSHVIIVTDGKEVPPSVIEYGASLAAKHSKAKGAPKTEVDYTLAKYVKKPQGAKPGMVIYTNYQTCVI